ncbi:MAG: L,D-transpeptidase [Ignavibacteria bacterium]|nr:L,D-transpeptidase [Ignavibacteria bacterium]
MKTILFFVIFFCIINNAFAQVTNSFPKINYRTVQFKKSSELNKFLKDFLPSKDKIKYRVITTLNRKELRYFRINQPIIVPDTFIEDLRAYSVFPQFYESAKNIPKLIIVSNIYQAYACYENGILVRFSAMNSGKISTPTYPGRYALQWKQRLRRSSFNENWIMPFTWNFHRLTGMAFHQFDMPGYPASHMCIRQFKDDAEWLFHWGEGPKKDSNGKFIPMSGTPVIIIDFYNFKAKEKKWLQLSSNFDIISNLPLEPLEFEEALIPIIHIPPDLRGTLSAKERKRYEFALDTLIARGILPKDIRLTPSKSLKRKTTDKKQLGNDKKD